MKTAYEVELRGHSFLVTGTYNPGEPRVTSGPAERWYPGSPPPPRAAGPGKGRGDEAFRFVLLSGWSVEGL